MKRVILSAVVLSLFLAFPAFAGNTSESLLKRAESGDAAACYDLGLKYNSGDGVAQDYKKAAEWYEKAAGKGNTAAEYDLGLINLGGQLGTRNYEKAVKCFESAAWKGHAVAMCKLGMMYYDGLGTGQDFILANAWLNVGLANGSPKGANDVARTLKRLSPEQLKEAEKKAAEISKKLEENKKTKK